MSTLGPKQEKELAQWAKRFLLEPEEIERVFESYASLLDGADDEAIAAGLAQLRGEIGGRRTDALTPRHLDQVVSRLDDAVAKSEIFAAADPELADLKRRLVAARTVVAAVRAAVARRSKP